jgi:hypothetical protein
MPADKKLRNFTIFQSFIQYLENVRIDVMHKHFFRAFSHCDHSLLTIITFPLQLLGFEVESGRIFACVQIILLRYKI